jgi:hypothetical protein
MEATEQNYRIAQQIRNLLTEENCTVQQSEEIMPPMRFGMPR